MKKTVLNKNVNSMKKLTLLFSALFLFISMGKTQTISNNKYQDEWNKVYALEDENLPQSIIEAVDGILQKAIKEDNIPQVIKAFIYKNKAKKNIDSDDNIEIYSDLENLLTKTENVSDRALLYSMLGELYGDYYSEHQRTIEFRTNLEYIPEDMETWSSNNYYDKIIECLDQSVANVEGLKGYTTQEYEDIIFMGIDAPEYYPTMYDFLMYRAIAILHKAKVYQANSRKYDDLHTWEQLSVPAKDFIKINFDHNNKYVVFRYYQQYLKDLFSRNMIPTIILTEIDKISYMEKLVYERFRDKEIAFAERLFEEYKENESALEIILYIVNNIGRTSLSQSDALDKGYQWCLRAKDLYPNAARIEIVNEEIKKMNSPSLNLKIADLHYPFQKIELGIKHRNLQSLGDFPILKICKIKGTDTTLIKKISLEYISQKSYIEQDTIYTIQEGLDIGQYIIYSDSVLSAHSNSYSDYRKFFVSRIGSFSTNMAGNGYDVYVVDRMSGHPIKDAVVDIYNFIKDDVSPLVQTKKILQTKKTDKYGLVEFRDIIEKDGSFSGYYSIRAGDDMLYSDGDVYFWNGTIPSWHEEVYGEPKENVSIFVDRGIYRPGQTVYFKAILMNRDSTLIEKSKVKVVLTDPNREEINSMELETNEFGSVAGEFVLPKSGLMGSYSITTSRGGYAYLRVEEYKRPTFEITFDKVKETYTFGHNIKVKGHVRNYSGIPLNGLDVKYSISAYQFMPWSYNNNANTLKTDTIQINDDGSFDIEFTPAENDVNSNSLLRRKAYQYTIKASVTDLNGETQEGQFGIGVGDISMIIKVDIPEQIDKNDSLKINMTTKNMSGELIKTTGEYLVYRLDKHDSIQNKILEGKFETGEQKELSRLLKKIESGKYRLLVKALDSSNEEVKDSATFVLYSYLDKKPPIYSNNWFVMKNSSFRRGKDAEFLLGVSDKDIRVVYQLYDGKNILKKEYLTLSNENKSFRIPYREEYGKGIYVYFTYVKNDQLYHEFAFLEKEEDVVDMGLILKLETFRDKLRPGQEETWTLSVKDRKGNPVVSEMLASMYDKSLDQIYESLDWKIGYPQRSSYYSLIGSIYYSYSVYNINSYFRKMGVGQPDSRWYVSDQSFLCFDKLKWFDLIQSSIGRSCTGTFKNIILDEEGDPILYASVMLGSKPGVGVMTDKSGTFVIDAEETDIIIISYPGYETLMIPAYRLMEEGMTLVMKMDTKEPQEYVTYATGGARKSSVNATIANDALLDLHGDASVANANLEEDTFFIRGLSTFGANDNALILVDGVEMQMGDIDASDVESFSVLKDASATAIYGSRGANGVLLITTKKAATHQNEVAQVRKKFNETAFFYPQLRTNENGEVQISFTVPESNTTWKFRALAHDKNSRAGQLMQTVISRKELMVTPNMPRFLREGDKTSISTKISNMSDKMFAGDVCIEFFNPIDDKPIDIAVENSRQPFAVESNQSVVAEWSFDVPRGIDFIGCRIVAGNASSSDGEQHSLVVLPSKVLVTESLPIDVIQDGETVHTFDKLKDNKSSTLENYKLTFEFASNPAWFAIQSLPVMSNPQNNNAVNWFAAYYVNTLGASLMKQYPQVTAMIEAWKAQGGDKNTFVSKLQQNEDLKNMLLSETPWVMEANDEAEQMNRLSLLFDLNTNSQKTKDATRKLNELQDEGSGGWTWFKGMYPSRSITQYILYGYASLQRAAMVEYPEDVKVMQMSALRYIDQEILSDYNAMKKNNKNWEKQTRIYTNQLEYLYVRSFYRDIPIGKETREAERFYTKVVSDNWTKLDLYECSLLAVVSKRNGDTALANKIVKSIRERSVTKDRMGMYWPNNKSHVFFSMSTVSVHVFLMEALKENGATDKELNLMKQWLVKQKQTQMWESTHATIDAIYALLSMGDNSLSVESSSATVKVGDVSIAAKDGMKGTGYIKTSWSGSDITSDKAVVTISKADKQLSYGALYWQYFENVNKIERTTSTGLQVDKKVLKEVQEGTEKKLVLITDESPLQVGDKVVMRLTIKVANDLEFVHVKDMRAPCFEPTQALSGVKWMDGACYYQETKDASTNFFFDRLPKGTYVLEYPVYVNRTGTYSNGITTIQSVYAPELRSHTDGIVITVQGQK